MFGFKSLVFFAFWCSLLSHAEIDVRLLDSNWQFEIDNRSLMTDFEPYVEELGFVKRIKILLAKGEYDSVIDAFFEREIKDESPALLNLRGQVLLFNNRFYEAEEPLLMAVEKHEDFASAHKNLSLLYMQIQHYDRARVHLQKAIALGVADAQVYGQLAYINFKLGSGASAVFGYQQALYLQPDSRQWQQGLLYALIQSSASKQALSLLEQMQNAEPLAVDFWRLRAQLLMSEQNYESVLQALEIAYRLSGGNCLGMELAIELHIKLQIADRAAELYEACGAVISDSHDGFNEKIIKQYIPWLIQQNQIKSADKIISAIDERGLDFNDQSSLALNKAKLSSLLDETAQSYKWLQKSVRLNGGNGEALILLAKYYESTASIEKAKLYFKRAQQVRDYEEPALLSLAQLYINLNDYGQAVESLQRVLELNPARKDVAKNIRIIKSMLRG